MPPTDEIVGTVAPSARSATLDANDPRGATKEIRRLSSLIDISQAVRPRSTSTLRCRRRSRSSSAIIVSFAARSCCLTRRPESCTSRRRGLTVDGQRARYRLGEGITGRVVESGKPIVVPETSREPLLLNRAARRQDRQELTFICVPLVINRKTIGALSVDLLFRRDRDYDRSLKFYKLVGAMIAQAIKVSRMAEAERGGWSRRTRTSRDELRDRYAFQHLIGTSAPIRQVYDQVAQVARTNTTVLMRGESGTGKEMIAHAIHYNSAARPEAVHQGELRGAARVADRVRAVRLRARRVHRARRARRRAASSWPTAARCSSTRSAT